MALGLRYPKCHEMGHIRTSGSGTNSQDPVSFSNTYLRFGGCLAFYVNPKRYSEVRKVQFWFNGVLHDATPPTTQNVRLRVGVSSSTNSKDNPRTAVLAPGAVYRVRGSGNVFGSATLTTGNLFNHAGEFVELQAVAALTDRASSMFVIEFDRFEPGHEDFFDAWDTVAAAATDDTYMQFFPVLELQSGQWSTDSKTQNLVVKTTGMAIVQAPAGVNRTSTIVNANPGWISFGAESTSFGTPRAIPFVWDPTQWDGVTAIHVWSFYPSAGSAGSWVGDMQVAAMQEEGGSVTAVQRYIEGFSDPFGSANIDALHRSKNILDSIEAGDFLGIEWRKDDAQAQNQPWGYFEIIQENFTKTVCPHPCSMSAPPSVNDLTEPRDYWFSKGYFDPQWYANFPDNRILSARLWGGLKQSNAGDDPIQSVILNADLQADPDSSGFNLLMQPRLTATPVATLGYKLLNAEVTANNPINFAGPRTLVTRMDAAVWNSGQPGGMLLAYALNVPNREFPELGPIFDLGAFNPEGCAATSAGLGNPPLFVITNGSTRPQKFNPTAAGTTAAVEDAGIPTPFEGEKPATVVNDAAQSPEGGLDLGTYRYRYTFRNCCTGKESDPNPEDIEVDTSGASPGASVTLSFAGVRIPADPQICEICIYRTVVGGDFPVMAKVGCFNVDDASTFVDDLADDALDFLNDGLSLLNAPMPCVPIVVDFRNRLFGMGDIPDLAPAGTVSVVNGSDIVYGDGSVEWTRCLEGKTIKVGADCRAYEILRVLPPEAGTSPAIARLKLTDPYEGATDSGLSYTLCGLPNRLYFSEPLEPEYWPAANFLDVEPGDGDRLMGAVSNFDRLVICKRRKTYVLTFRENPGTEVIVPSRISSDIGCIAPRSFAQVESGSVWLSDRGLALFDGRSVQHIEESANMNDIFTDPDNPNYVRRDRNGRVIEAVGVFYPRREQYLLLLPTIQTERGCNVMLVWDTKLRNITLLRFCQEFLSMEVGRDADGNERVYLGDTNGFVWIFDIGYTDGVGYPNATGQVRGTILEAGTDPSTGADYLKATTGGFITGGLPGLAGLSGVDGLSGAFGGDDLGVAGVCVFVRPADAAYDDPWESRVVYAATDDTLYVTPPWGSEKPLSGYEFMLGPIELDLLFKPQNYGTDDILKRDWRQVVVHEVEDYSSELRIDLLPDFQLSDPEADSVVDAVTGETGEGRIFRMDFARGRQVQPVGRYVHAHMAVRMRNFAPEQPITIINHVLMTTPRSSK